MNQLSFAFITPSYAPDFERCQLLCRSIKQFVSPSVDHYIIVDQIDVELFQRLQDSNTKIISKQSLLPFKVKCLPLGKTKQVWFSQRTLPFRGWIFQQIAKLAVAQIVDKDILVYVDSDLAFVRPLNLQSFIRGDKVRLFRDPYEENISQKMFRKKIRMHKNVSRLLGLPSPNQLWTKYDGNILPWRRENILKLYQHLEKISGHGWIETLCNSWSFSENCMYGGFVTYILQEQSGHYDDDQYLCHTSRYTPNMSDEELQNFLTKIRPEHIAVMISAKSGISVDRYQALLSLIESHT